MNGQLGTADLGGAGDKMTRETRAVGSQESIFLRGEVKVNPGKTRLSLR